MNTHSRRSVTGLIVIVAVAVGVLSLSTPALAATPAPSSTGYSAYVPGSNFSASTGDVTTNLVSPGCGTGVAEATLINVWSRTPGSSGTANLRCGTQATSGLRHINNEHGTDWDTIRSRYAQPGDWSSFMKNVTAANLTGGFTTITYGSNKDTYHGYLCIRQNNNGAVVRAYDVIIPVGSDNNNIITSYPSNGRSSDPHC